MTCFLRACFTNLKQLQAAVVGIVYVTGYLHWSVAWFICPVILSVLRDQWRVKSENKRNVAKAVALSSEKELVLARLDDLPSWVCDFIELMISIRKENICSLLYVNSLIDVRVNIGIQHVN